MISEYGTRGEPLSDREADARPDSPAGTMLMKSTAGVVAGVGLIVLSLVLAALGQLIALALLIIAIPIVVWGASRAKPKLLNQLGDPGEQASPSSRG